MNKNLNIRRYILLSHHRSGTSFLTQKLNEHPSIFSGDEIFNTNKKTRLFFQQNDLSAYKNQPGIDVREFINTYVHKVFELFQKPVIGFQVFANQISDNDIQRLISSKEYTIIFLWRKNLLQAAVSYQIAKQTSQWNKSQAQNLNGLELDPGKIGKFIKKVKRAIPEYRKIIKDNHVPFLELNYEILFKQETFRSIYRFLEVTEPEQITIPHTKLNNISRYKQLENYNEIDKKFSSQENGILFQEYDFY